MKIDILRELTTAQQRAEIIREQIWKATSIGTKPDLNYLNNLAINIDELLSKVIINLRKRENEDAQPKR